MSLVRALLDATPAPPAELGEIDALTATFLAITESRQRLIDAAVRPVVMTDEDRALLVELRGREAAWQALLERARDRLRDQRIGAGKLKGYVAGLG